MWESVRSAAIVASKETDKLIANINPRAKLPSNFVLWSAQLQLMWLRQNQKKSVKRKVMKKFKLKKGDNKFRLLPPKKTRPKGSTDEEFDKSIIVSPPLVLQKRSVTDLLEQACKQIERDDDMPPELNAWWSKQQKVIRVREEKLRQQAIKKLTPAERQACGLK